MTTTCLLCHDGNDLGCFPPGFNRVPPAGFTQNRVLRLFLRFASKRCVNNSQGKGMIIHEMNDTRFYRCSPEPPILL